MNQQQEIDLDHIENRINNELGPAIDRAGEFAGFQLRGAGHSFTELTPGDHTKYSIAIVTARREFVVACIIGPATAFYWDGMARPSRHEYAEFDNRHTSFVITRFLNAAATTR